MIPVRYAVALCLGLAGAWPGTGWSAAVNWELTTMGGREYVPFAQVAEFYDFPVPVAKGRLVTVSDGKRSMSVTLDSREAFVNGGRVWLSFEAREHQGRLMVSRTDLAKTIEPLMRPMRIPTGAGVKTVILDAGHGGHDKGAGSSWTWNESRLTLDIVRRLKPLLEAEGFAVILTRDSDVFVDLMKRARTAPENKDAIFVSVHFNSYNRTASGVETFCLTPRGTPPSIKRAGFSSEASWQEYAGHVYDANNVLLAGAVQRRLAEIRATTTEDRGVKRHRYAVLSYSPRPAILVEGGFIDGRADGKLLSDPVFRDRMAGAIRQGILDYRSLLRTGSVSGPSGRAHVAEPTELLGEESLDTPVIETELSGIGPVALDSIQVELPALANGTNGPAVDKGLFRPSLE